MLTKLNGSSSSFMCQFHCHVDMSAVRLGLSSLISFLCVSVGRKRTSNLSQYTTRIGCGSVRKTKCDRLEKEESGTLFVLEIIYCTFHIQFVSELRKKHN